MLDNDLRDEEETESGGDVVLPINGVCEQQGSFEERSELQCNGCN